MEPPAPREPDSERSHPTSEDLELSSYLEQSLTPGPSSTADRSPVRGRGDDRVRQGASVDQLFEVLPPAIPVWMSHGDRITELPPGFRALAHSDSSPYAVMANDRGLIGLQFHPEVVHTPHGKQLLENFLLRVCGCRGDWTAGNFIADSILRIREQVGDGRVICALSGGVDSAVTAALVHR